MISINDRGRVPCPVDGCDFDLAADMASAPFRVRIRSDLPVGEALTEGINEQAREDAKAREAQLRAHLETHDVLDWMRTVRRLEQDLAQQDSGIRPHVYRAQMSEDDRPPWQYKPDHVDDEWTSPDRVLYARHEAP